MRKPLLARYRPALKDQTDTLSFTSAGLDSKHKDPNTPQTPSAWRAKFHHVLRWQSRVSERMSGESVQQLIEQLEDKASTRRRSAAKKLRRLKPRQAGPALLNALANEIKDERTWETQYQMIMALGEIGYTESLDFLYQLTDRELDATMVHIATGDAITRLTYIKDGSVTNALNLIDSKRDSLQLIEGIFRAIAILKLVPQEEEIERIVGYGISASTTDNNQTWIASAAAGWNGVNVEHFLTRCATSDNPQVKKAAEYALNKRYPKWSIL